MEIPTVYNGADIEPDCSPDFDFPPRGSITKSEASENTEKKVTVSSILFNVNEFSLFLVREFRTERTSEHAFAAQGRRRIPTSCLVSFCEKFHENYVRWYRINAFYFNGLQSIVNWN